MNSILIAHIRKSIDLNDSEAEMVLSYFDQQTIRKKTLLLEEGHICNKQYFILKGCLRSYIINAKGNEQTLQFGIESWWVTDYMSFQNQNASHFFIQAIENSEVLSISKTALEELLSQLPKLERYFKLTLQKSFGAAQMRIKYLFTMTAEERYHHFNDSFPDFVQRVPQYMLASYLDFSPEFMSKIRAGKI
ncbi:Crp/Fnr family transcriptional regulator [Flavobacterium humi]|uniref:Crp/Fnr family transcriptional regulator n=1 Tax=Flavobacterium humi TaxID=2562683 RepID=A0A4Z0L694_9FLAO|nr:Crp/Fnr family transcriptional regulator [Flavobacterium humi]TGD56636.1 Crp/Fnr family transcriptional regulator [Flavobacterium humi]